jgi:hypothetical protein
MLSKSNNSLKSLIESIETQQDQLCDLTTKLATASQIRKQEQSEKARISKKLIDSEARLKNLDSMYKKSVERVVYLETSLENESELIFEMERRLEKISLVVQKKDIQIKSLETRLLGFENRVLEDKKRYFSREFVERLDADKQRYSREFYNYGPVLDCYEPGDDERIDFGDSFQAGNLTKSFNVIPEVHNVSFIFDKETKDSNHDRNKDYNHMNERDLNTPTFWNEGGDTSVLDCLNSHIEDLEILFDT